jgi:hypothetical protein
VFKGAERGQEKDLAELFFSPLDSFLRFHIYEKHFVAVHDRRQQKLFAPSPRRALGKRLTKKHTKSFRFVGQTCLTFRTFCTESPKHFLISSHSTPTKHTHSHSDRHLDFNEIENFDNITLSHRLLSIQNLRLEGNLLARVPTKLLSGFATTLEAL